MIKEGGGERARSSFCKLKKYGIYMAHFRTYMPCYRIEIRRVGQNHMFIRIYGVHTVFLAGKSPYIRPYTVYIQYF